VRIVNNLDAPDGSSDFRRRLLAIRQDPQVIRLAHKWAGDPHLAEDALQTADYKVATAKGPEGIDNLKAYYIRVLKNEITTVLAPRRAIPVENPEAAPQPGLTSVRHKAWMPHPRRWNDMVGTFTPYDQRDGGRQNGTRATAAAGSPPGTRPSAWADQPERAGQQAVIPDAEIVRS
jgi:hypothetical protein